MSSQNQLIGTFALQNLDTNEQFFYGSAPLLANACTNQGNPTSLYEYIYLRPGDRLKWTVTFLDGFSTNNNGQMIAVYALFAGVEYLMEGAGG